MELSRSLIKTQNKTVFWIPNSLKVVCEVIDKECVAPGRYSSLNQLFNLLRTLNHVERSFIANYFCQLPWNVSSVRVLAPLHRLRILTASEYILSQTDDEHIQLVLNDFLETEFDLMANLIIYGHFDLLIGAKITEYVDESIRRLFVDLAKNQHLNSLDYLDALKFKVPKNLHAKLVDNHLRKILAMHKISTKLAFTCFSDWIQLNPDKYELVNNFYKNAVESNELDVVKSLLNISSAPNFTGWMNYLLLLGMIVKNRPAHCCSFIKKWIKDRLKLVSEDGSVEAMAHLILSIRVVLLFQEDQTETYAKWYKQNIGDMKFVLNATEFKTMIAVLIELVLYETDEEYLQVHVQTSISPPVMCSQLCRDYKTVCRSRISEILASSQEVEIPDIPDEDLFPNI